MRQRRANTGECASAHVSYIEKSIIWRGAAEEGAKYHRIEIPRNRRREASPRLLRARACDEAGLYAVFAQPDAEIKAIRAIISSAHVICAALDICMAIKKANPPCGASRRVKTRRHVDDALKARAR